MEMLIVILILGLLFRSCLAQNTGQDEPKVRCKASAVRMGGEGLITCLFPVDLDQIHSAAIVSVQKYIDTDETHVLSCIWDDISHCNDVRPGYTLGEAKGRTLKITIRNVAQAHMGKYHCLVMVASGPIDAEPCSFHFKGTVPPNPPPSLLSADQAQTTSHDNIPGSSSEPNVGAIAGIVSGSVVLMVGVIVGILSFTRCRRRNRRHKHWRVEVRAVTCLMQQEPFLHDGHSRNSCHETDVEQHKSFLHDHDHDHDHPLHDQNGRNSSLEDLVLLRENTDVDQQKLLLPDGHGKPGATRGEGQQGGCVKQRVNEINQATFTSPRSKMSAERQSAGASAEDVSTGGRRREDSEGAQETAGLLKIQCPQPKEEPQDYQINSAIPSGNRSSVEVAEEALEDLAPASSAADIPGEVSGKPEDKTDTTGEEEEAKPVTQGVWGYVSSFGSKATGYLTSFAFQSGSDENKANQATDSRADTSSHLESSTNVPPVTSDTTKSGTGGPDDEGSTADRTEEETDDAQNDEAAPTEPIKPEDKNAETSEAIPRDPLIPRRPLYGIGSDKPTTGGEGPGKRAAGSSDNSSPQHGDDDVKASMTTGAGAGTSRRPLSSCDVTPDPPHSTKRGTEEKRAKSVEDLTSVQEPRGQQDPRAAGSRTKGTDGNNVGKLRSVFEPREQQESTATVSSPGYGRGTSALGRQGQQRDTKDVGTTGKSKSLYTPGLVDRGITCYVRDPAMIKQWPQDTTARSEDSEADIKGGAPYQTRSKSAQPGVNRQDEY